MRYVLNVKEGYDIIVDTREKSNVRKILDSYGIKYKLETLHVGDYEIRTPDGNVTIERKSVTDFIQSLMSGRLEEQMRHLAILKCPMLLLTGNYGEYRRFAKNSSFTADQMIGAIASCITKYGLRSVIWIEGEHSQPHSQGLALAIKLMKKISEGKLDNIPDRKLKNREGKPQRELVHLTCGVPSNVAEELLKTFKSPLKIFLAKDEDLLKVRGMGKSRIQKMRSLLGDLN